MKTFDTADVAVGYDYTDADPGVTALLDRKQTRVSDHLSYSPIEVSAIETHLKNFFSKTAPGSTVRQVSRMGGGASKEQFLFTLDNGVSESKYVLRMDPIQTAAETDRQREFEVLNAFSKHLPAPRADWIDYEGKEFGQPFAIMNFVPGVTKPTAKSDGPNVTGIGTTFNAKLRSELAPQFIKNLALIHNIDWRQEELPSFAEPRPNSQQSALWQINWISRVWRDDKIHASPVAAIAERWLRRNLPTNSDVSMIHGDYRTGNFLFDEESREITAILDWEWAHLGDFHEDLGWMLQDLYASTDDNQRLICGLLTREEMIEAYESASGRTVDLKTLRWYEIFCAYKCYAITLATSIKAARDGANHQDVMLSWMAPVGHRFATEICKMIASEETA
ncbi:phosphotransferase family protein [Rhodococcus qingshengii]|uniref:phosphotransferase family protein n=1 Tax=Rhodococcus qingshengii TaxID=334542 RepID=UPI0024B9251F|nr:phosphotransferase family protein [Rhodococcus qingshengii]MDJ0490737.1 phosphotransferase family protein [Rhodococcus qingshengii]